MGYGGYARKKHRCQRKWLTYAADSIDACAASVCAAAFGTVFIW